MHFDRVAFNEIEIPTITREDLEKAQKAFNERTTQSPFCDIPLHQSRFAKIVIGKGVGAIKITNVDDKEYKFELLEDVEIFATTDNPAVASRGPAAVAEERLLQLATIMGQTTIEGVKAEEAFRKLTAMALQHDYFDEHPDLYKKKKDKPTWSPGFGAPVRRSKK